MDFSTLKVNLKDGKFATYEEFLADLQTGVTGNLSKRGAIVNRARKNLRNLLGTLRTTVTSEKEQERGEKSDIPPQKRVLAHEKLNRQGGLQIR